jgi:uncharacterized membrane protein
MKTVVGLFDNYNDADNVVAELERLRYNKNNINVIAREDIIKQRKSNSSGAAEGATTGATIGGLVGLLAGIGVIVIPGIGPLIAVGPIAAALSSTAVGAGVGAATGGVIGALVNAGVSAKEAEFYIQGIKKGDILVAVTAANENQSTEIRNIMRANNVIELETQRAPS